jgi:hypothetical protein
MSASIGFRDPRGFPVYASSKILKFRSIRVSGAAARVVASIETSFADRGQPSIEDDLIYLDRAAGGWLLAKASATLYRAIGTGDIPPTVLSPP